MTQIAGSLDTALPRHAPTLAHSIQERVARTPDRRAYQYPRSDGTWAVMTWRDVGAEMTAIAAGLLSLGLEPEDRVAIASSTRIQWVLADGAVMLAGGANTTIYPSTGEDDFGYIMADSGARFLVAEDRAQAEKALAQRERLPDLVGIIQIDGEGDGELVMSWAQLRQRGADALAADPGMVMDAIAAIRPDSLATIIYTSGTTGRPKGVELTHSNWAFQGASVEALDIMHIDDVHYMWLPLAHSFGKVLLAAQYQIGLETAIDGRIDQIVANLPVVRPTLMAGVPRIFEKIYQGANAKARASGGAKAGHLRLGVQHLGGHQGHAALGPVGRTAGRPPDGGRRQAGLLQDPGAHRRAHPVVRLGLSGPQRGRRPLVRRGGHADHRGLRLDRELRCCLHRASRRPGVRHGRSSRSPAPR